MPVLRPFLLALAVLAMLAGASGELSPLLSTALLVTSMLTLACDPSSPVPRAVRRGLRIPVDGPTPAADEVDGVGHPLRRETAPPF
jgi:hypothetical protein